MVAALALAGGACGGDDDGDATDVTDAAADASDASDTSSVDENSAADEVDEADSGDDSGGGDWCRIATDLDSNDILDDVDIEDPDAIENAFEEMIDLSEEAADSAPDEIKDDVEFVVDAAKDLVDQLRDVDFDFTALDQSLLDNPEATAAGDRIDAYNERVCGIESDDAVDDTDITVADDSGDDTGTTDVSGLDDGTAREQIIAQLTAVGLTDAQATCIVDNIDDLEEFAQTGSSDPTAFLNLVGTCEIDLTQLTPPTATGG